MRLPLELPPLPLPGLRRMGRDFGATYATNGLIGFVFAATGPVAVLLSVGTRGGLSEPQLSSWIFGSFFLNGLISVLMCWLYRQPLVLFWTIPGAVLVGPALGHLSFPQVVGAYYVTGVLMAVLGMIGIVRRAMSSVPMPIVMGMVAGVFLRFGVDLVRALREDWPLAAPMTAAFVAFSVSPALARRAPPLLVAMAVGAIAIAVLGRFHADAGLAWQLASPIVPDVQFSWQAIAELVVPLAIAVLVVQNGQGVAVLDAAGHRAPINAITLACGLGTIASAAVGAVPTCLTGPTNAIVAASGDRSRHYTGGIVCALLAVAFGAFSPVFTHMLLATPKAFIATLAGLAMLRVLQAAFAVSFRDRHTLGALVSFLVTVSEISIANVGAPFWGLVAGFAVSWLLEREPAR